MAQNLRDQGHKVEVLTTRFDPATPAYETYQGLPITRVPFQFKISRTHYSCTIIGKFIQMLPNFDTIIINSPNSNVLFYAAITKLFGKKLVIYHQADILLPRQTGNQIKHRAIEMIFDTLTLPAMRLADIVSSFTYDYAAFSRVMRHSLDKFQAYIPDVKLSQASPRKKLKTELDGLKKEHLLIGISGRFVEEKGFDVLFEALPLIRKVFPSAHIAFAGKHIVEYEPFFEQHRELFDSQKEHVTYLGLLSGGDLAYFYECLDVFVLSSRIECFALTQIEALQKHIPIVVTDVPGARQLVLASGFGEVVNRENPEDLAEGIIKVLAKPEVYKKHYAKARAYLEQHRAFRLPE
jgi:glycosyltransferase involved in cell wall biosynthesis